MKMKIVVKIQKKNLMENLYYIILLSTKRRKSKN